MLHRLTTAAAAIALAASTAMPAAAQEDMTGADDAADLMITEVYVPDTPYMTPTEVVAMLTARGYTDLHDFDVEWGNYEIEGTSPGGEDLELEIDPLTGAIVDVDRDWF